MFFTDAIFDDDAEHEDSFRFSKNCDRASPPLRHRPPNAKSSREDDNLFIGPPGHTDYKKPNREAKLARFKFRAASVTCGMFDSGRRGYR
jgi:hypothetical protein